MMKTKYPLLSIALTFALTLPLFGQHTHEDKNKTDMKQHSMSSMMGKPTVDVTVEGLHIKGWLMTQKQHKKLMDAMMGQKTGEDMKEMKHDGMEMKDTSMRIGKDMKGMTHDDMGMAKAMMDSVMAGTHCIILDISDPATKKAISDANAKVMFVSPSKKHSSVDLKPMMSHFGGGLTLNEKGEYEFTVSVNVGGVPKATQFEYRVK